jgi:peroxiredoxin
MKKTWLPGDPVPEFRCRSSNNALFNFHTAAGRYLVLSFFGSAAIAKNAEVLRYVATELRACFDDEHMGFFGVSIDPADEKSGRVRQSIPGIRFFWDFDQAVSREFGLADEGPAAGDTRYRSLTLVLDPFLRVLAVIPMAEAAQHNAELAKTLAALPPLNGYAGVPISAPVLVLPRVFEPEFCRELIGLYHTHGGMDSGFMREREGKTVGILDHSFKRRRDFLFDEMPELEALRGQIRGRIGRRLIPAIHKAFQFKVTRIERYVVSCYDGGEGGFFRAHRDNTTKGTAHRRFACTINLNEEAYEGGNLRFPEFGTGTYRAPTGGAVVFSCSLLHEATPVTKGTRYAFLPFLYDDEGARIREENRGYVVHGMKDENIKSDTVG